MLVSVPLTPLSTFLDRWIFGEILCKFLPASQVFKNNNKIVRVFNLRKATKEARFSIFKNNKIVRVFNL